MSGDGRSFVLTTDVNKIHNNNSSFSLCIITECPENLQMISEIWNFFLAHGHKSVSQSRYCWKLFSTYVHIKGS